MKQKLFSIGIIAGALSLVLVSNSVFAQTPTTTGQSATSSIRRAAKLEATAARLQKKADAEIDRRIEALTKLQTKINGIKKISSAQKSSLTTTIQNQINLLGNLKIKIAADTDTATLKTDVQSITKAYRIFALVLPQVEILAGADRLSSATDMLADLATKLQARVASSTASSTNVAAIQSLLADIQSKITDARTQAQNAINGVSALVPDNGDKTIMASNTTALKTARTAIKNGTQDVKTALKDANSIKKYFKKDTNKDVTATSTSSN